MGKKSRKDTAVGALTGVVSGSLKRREHVEPIHVEHGTPIRLSLKDWRVALLATKDAVGDRNLPAYAAGIAYYSVLAFFPFLAALVAIAALLVSPEQLEALASAAQQYLPPDISTIITAQLHSFASRRSDNIIAAAVAITLALFGASIAAKGLVTASNAVYGVKESRGWVVQQVWGIIWTVVGLGFVATTLALLSVNGELLRHIGAPEVLVTFFLYGRWIALFLFCILGLAIFYRYGPNRPRVRWQCVGWGAVLATVAWLVTTSLFFVYVQYFADYTQSYSIFAGIIVLMIWMNLSALIVLLGAEINHQLERVGHKKRGGLFSRLIS